MYNLDAFEDTFFETDSDTYKVSSHLFNKDQVTFIIMNIGSCSMFTFSIDVICEL